MTSTLAPYNWRVVRTRAWRGDRWTWEWDAAVYANGKFVIGLGTFDRKADADMAAVSWIKAAVK